MDLWPTFASRYGELGSPCSPLALLGIGLALLSCAAPCAPQPEGRPLYVFCGTGDHLWVRDREPVDSPATIDAMLQWMADTYGISRLYWRGGQTQIWDDHYKVGPQTPLQYDWAIGWKRRLYRELKINEAAVASAHRHGMQAFLYTGLFEHGVQPDVGIVCPYLVEDHLRIEHPEWCMVDRWGQRRCPGPIAFCYPQARRAVIDRYLQAVRRYGYDGINFYTYVENVGIRYPDEFGFNEPVIDEFRKQYLGVDPRSDSLTPQQRLDWQKCRGKFVTQFLRELHAALSAEGKRLSVILDSKQPNYPQPWWGKEFPGTGMIYLDWEAWVEEGIVDELWVQLGATADQVRTLDAVLAKCEGKPVAVTFRTPAPFDATWEPYIARGVTPVACITSPRNGIERYCLDPTSVGSLHSADWRLRLQSVADVAQGRLQADAAQIAVLAGDPHVLVRRKVMYALAALKAQEHVSAIERAMADPESSVRIAAAAALATVHGHDSSQRVLQALERNNGFQFKLACIDALAGMGLQALPALLASEGSTVQAVQEVRVRALYVLGREGQAGQVYEPLRAKMLDRATDDAVRYWAIESLVGLRLKLAPDRQRQLADDLVQIVDGPACVTVQLHAAWGLGYLASTIDADVQGLALQALGGLLKQYGDGCARPDAAFGWRVAGNSILMFHQPGRDLLEKMRTQTDDRWLAWIAYQIRHVPQRSGQMALVEKQDAVDSHKRYAPAFPGRRIW